MKLLLGFFFFYLFSSYSVANEFISKDRFQEIEIQDDFVDFFVDSDLNNIKVRQEGSKLFISSIKVTKASLILIKDDGSTKIYFLDFYSSGRSKKKEDYLVSGKIIGRGRYSEDANSNPYRLGLNLTLKLTDNTKFAFSANEVGDLVKQGKTQTIDYWRYSFFNNYLEYGRIKTGAGFGYRPVSLRGYTLGRETRDYHIGVWTSDELYSNVKSLSKSLDKFEGAFLNLKLLKNLKLNLNVDKKASKEGDVIIPVFNISYSLLGITGGTSFSSLDDKNYLTQSVVKDFKGKQGVFSLRRAGLYYGIAENGSFGLRASDDVRRERAQGYLDFRRNSNFGTLEEEAFMPGETSLNLRADYSQNGKIINKGFNSTASFQDFKRIKIHGALGYSTQDVLGISRDNLTYSPTIDLYVFGEKRDGVFLRINQMSSLTDSMNTQTESNTSTVGLYRHKIRYHYGMYLGEQKVQGDNSQTINSLLGLNANYKIRTNSSVSSTASYSRNRINLNDVLRANLKFKHRFKDINYYLSTSYSRSSNYSADTSRENLYVTAGFTYDFSIGKKNAYREISYNFRTLQGVAFLDTNFNGIMDADEKEITGVTVSIGKSGINEKVTDSSGFSFRGFDDSELISINASKEGLSSYTSSLKMDSSKTINIPLYKEKEMDVFLNFNSENVVLNDLEFDCDPNSKLKKEFLNDRIKVFLPDSIECSPQIKENSIFFIREIIKNNDKMTIFIEKVNN